MSRGRIANAIANAVGETVVKLEAGYTPQSRRRLRECLGRFARDLDRTFNDPGSSTIAGEIFRVVALDLWPDDHLRVRP